jgi:hypoxanthine phosphoribosyltransferase
MEKKYLSWKDVCKLVDRIVPKVTGHFDALIAITRGGIVPGGLLSERLGILQVYTASIRFFHDEDQNHSLDWPIFMQFPEDSLLHGRRILVIDDIWHKGITVTSVAERIAQAGGEAVTLVLHYRPSTSILPDLAPDIFGEETEDYIVYPWEAEHGKLGV